MLEQGDILTLNDEKKYIIVSIIEYNQKKYCYLIDINDNKNINFSEIINNDELEEVKDYELKMLLLEKFNEDLNK